jgi:hypothetical protein
LHRPSVTSARDGTGYCPRMARNNPSLCVLVSNSVESRSWQCYAAKSPAACRTHGASPTLSAMIDAGRFREVHGILAKSGRLGLRLSRCPVRPEYSPGRRIPLVLPPMIYDAGRQSEACPMDWPRRRKSLAGLLLRGLPAGKPPMLSIHARQQLPRCLRVNRFAPGQDAGDVGHRHAFGRHANGRQYNAPGGAAAAKRRSISRAIFRRTQNRRQNDACWSSAANSRSTSARISGCNARQAFSHPSTTN